MAKPFITPEGQQMLRRELDFLWLKKRPEITDKVAWAASLGDRSENADYHYNKALLAQIDRRIRYLRARLNELHVIKYDPKHEGEVFFGAYVEIESDEDESIRALRIVGGDEISRCSSYISIDSPMARALLGKAAGDEAVVEAPRGRRVWYVNKIAYETPEWFTAPESTEPKFEEEAKTAVAENGADPRKTV